MAYSGVPAGRRRKKRCSVSNSTAVANSHSPAMIQERKRFGDR
jgi:hypothetical protein